MFKLVRLPVLFGVAFLVGVFFERNAALEKCEAAGGQVSGGICRGISE